MKIGIDVYALSKLRPFAGISNYLYNILKYLEVIDQENEYFLYNNEDINLPFNITNNAKWKKRIYNGLLRKSHTLWLNTVLVGQLLKDNIDIFWQPSGALLPIFIPKKINTFLTIHDLLLYYHPETMEWSNRFISGLFFDKSYKKADVVIVVSNSTAKDIIKLFPKLATSKKPYVIQEGIDDKIFIPLDRNKSRDFVKTRFKINNNYILFVGTTEDRKNLHVLIKAFSVLVKCKKNINHQLVVVGKEGWRKLNIPSLLHQTDMSDNEIKFLGYVDIQDLVYLYSGATAFIMPSLYEGFGLPLLEAMACGCPVITSNISSMPEVAGDAAVLVDPYNIEELAKTIHNVLNDQMLQRNMRDRGFKNVEKFSWKKAAQETLKVLINL